MKSSLRLLVLVGCIFIGCSRNVEALNYTTLDNVVVKEEDIKKLEKDISYLDSNWVNNFEEDYSLFIVESIYDRNPDDNKSVVGLHDPEKKEILIRKDIYTGTLFHEFGHFIHSRLNNSEDFEFIAFDTLVIDIYKEEQEALSKIMGDYCKTNYREFFAEAYEYGINLVKLKELDEDFFYKELNRWGLNCPRMKTLIWDGIINNSEVLYNSDVINSLIEDVKAKYPNYLLDYSYFRILLSGLY